MGELEHRQGSSAAELSVAFDEKVASALPPGTFGDSGGGGGGGGGGRLGGGSDSSSEILSILGGSAKPSRRSRAPFELLGRGVDGVGRREARERALSRRPVLPCLGARRKQRALARARATAPGVRMMMLVLWTRG